MLQNHEKNALDDFVRSLLKHEILPTSEIVEEEDDDDLEFVVDKFDDEDDFISFEDENEGENALHAENAGHAKHDNLRTNHSIDDEFNPGDFFDDMNDERAFEALYS
jgi:hypothetical protein